MIHSNVPVISLCSGCRWTCRIELSINIAFLSLATRVANTTPRHYHLNRVINHSYVGRYLAPPVAKRTEPHNHSKMSVSSLFTRSLKERFPSVSRFGHSSSFPDLFSSDKAVSRNYITGLLIAALLILIALLCWLVALLLSKLCSKRAGFLSGAPFKTLRDDGTKNPWIARGSIILAISSVFCIIFAIVLATAGIGNLDTTTGTIWNGADVRNT
jgi:hypothetical protein